MRFRKDGGRDRRFKEKGKSPFILLLLPYYFLKYIFLFIFYFHKYLFYTVSKNLYMKLKNKFWSKKENFKFFQNEEYMSDDNILNRSKLDFTTIFGVFFWFPLLMVLLPLVFVFNFYKKKKINEIK